MDPLVPPNVERMIPYKPGKPLEELERELGIRDAIKLASNENPIGPSPKVTAALREAAASLHFYPDGAGFSLRSAIADHHGIAMDEVCLGNGSNELIDLLCRTFPSRDDHIVFGKPSFVCYWLGATAAGVSFSEVPLKDHLAWDIDAMLAAVQPNTKLLFLANPNNPTGAHVGEADLRRLLEGLPPRVVCVIDEAYVEFADADDYVSALSLRDLRERLIVLRTFSKAYGLAGLRVGYALGPPSLIDYLMRMRAPFNVGSLGQLAARVALEDPDHVAAYVALNAKERTRVAAGLRELGLEVAPSQANFVLVNVKRPGAEVYDALLRRGVIVRTMPPPIDTWLRVSIGTEPMNDRLLNAMREVVQ
ncbi:MAG: histidinol-phosphate transaminase [Myxococcota bacterium]